MEMRKENFKIDFAGIGAEKCATTWVYRCLQEHPELHLMPKDNKKGAWFWSSSKDEDTKEFYEFFLNKAKPDQKLGEYNNYYMRKEGVIQRMKNHNPDIKLIVSLRDPVERAWSAYLHHYSLSTEEEGWESFNKAKNKLPETIIEPGFYYQYLGKYFDSFPEENIFILLVDDIKKDPVGSIQNIYDFLEVDDNFVPSKAKTKVGTSKFKMTGLGKFVHQKMTPALKKTKLGWLVNESSLLGKVFYPLVQFYARLANPGLNMSLEVKKKLYNTYEEDADKLEELINRNLDSWKYE
ncbi:hypothetical protein AKJ56_01685 [candidate division MSBL1 archaeon SCGC-AAA382N08]|uniref:Sulfotransferase domain-containing protein n=1 Tax=candidate division MSBL1 archaeon SCGC-AAA382N08 TaxID=1698285 RepID=A0A133VP71_9EURY|nr:hypothetical protein AKJ56_01685 [candidate division MSBL1 archaeon SCGC-AAA382N08]